MVVYLNSVVMQAKMKLLSLAIVCAISFVCVSAEDATFQDVKVYLKFVALMSPFDRTRVFCSMVFRLVSF